MREAQPRTVAATWRKVGEFLDLFSPAVAVWAPANNGSPGKPCMLFDADPGVEFKMSVNVAFREVGLSHSPPVIETLREFSRWANSIIGLFD
jgi:hypothetical protein